MGMEKIVFLLSRVEMLTLESVAIFEPWLPDAIDHRRRAADQYQVTLEGEEIKDCLDALMFAVSSGMARGREAELLAALNKISGYARIKDGMAVKNKIVKSK
jgi:hypothetical protein